MSKKNLFIWTLRVLAALIMLQTLFYKFSGAEESIYIFSMLGMEPWGRIATGIGELFASVLILVPRTTVYGAVMAMGIMAGALVSHIFILGVEVKGDGGQLFMYALLVFISSGILLYIFKEHLIQRIKKLKQLKSTV